MGSFVCPDFLQTKADLSCVGRIVFGWCYTVVPPAAQERTLLLAHKGHQGIVKMKQRLLQWFGG